MKYSVFIILFFVCQLAIAQKTVSIKDAVGKAYMSDDKTANQTKDKAIEEAKKDALKKAGVAEYIGSSNVLLTAESNKKISQVFNSIASVELSGAITNIQNIRLQKKHDESAQQDYYEALIDADVIKYEKKSDPSFVFDIKGIRESYKANEALTFETIAYANGFLRIFLLSDSQCFQLFPNQYEKANSIKESEHLHFPINKGIAYSLDLKEEIESDNLIFVFTKNNIPFTGKENMNDILHWIYSISPDERRVKNFSFVVSE